jgi:aspartyl-tRNA(Asn)/glutamyl-tRNA(Gln) amidotransferase subunit A
LETFRLLSSAGHSIHQVSLPSTRFALSAYYVLAPAEASSNLAKYDGVRYGTRSTKARAPENVLFSTTRREGLGDEVRRRILLGSYSLSASAIDNYFIQAQRVRRFVQRDFDRAFALQNPLLDISHEEGRVVDDSGVDILLSPTAPSLPPSLESLRNRSPIDSYRDDVLTVPASLAGLPAISVPVPCDSGVATRGSLGGATVGLQITAQYGDDGMVFHAAQVLEELLK